MFQCRILPCIPHKSSQIHVKYLVKLKLINPTLIVFSETPPWLALGGIIIMLSSTPPFAAKFFASSFLVFRRSLSSKISLVRQHYDLLVYTVEYFEKMFSSILVVGLARVSIFQLISTDERSPILTWRIDCGHGSANWYGSGWTMMADKPPPGLATASPCLEAVSSFWDTCLETLPSNHMLVI